MKPVFVRNLSFNAVQLLTNQLFGFLVFYLLAKGLTKADFGEWNWSLAVLLAVFNILPFGIDQLIVQKIASGKKASAYVSLYFFHIVLTGLLFYGLLVLGYIFFPYFFKQHSLLLLLGVGKLFFFFATPFKQLANGQEQFRWLLYMSVGASILKGAGLLYLTMLHQFTLLHAVVIFILADITEYIVCLYIAKKKLNVHFNVPFNKWKQYIALIKESLPQLGVVLFSSALARFDWILIGLLTSSVKLAEYSFAYKIFEISTLPLLIIAPLLVPLFTRTFTQKGISNINNQLAFLFRLEIIVASLTALVLNILWVPVVDTLTNGEYGRVNKNTIFILSFCLPLLYLNNFLWSLHFSKGHLKSIFYIFAVAFVVNIAANFLLIPLWGNEGAAIAYLLSVLTQSIMYLRYTNETLPVRWQTLFICIFCALASGLLTVNLLTGIWAVLFIALTGYLLLLLLTAQLRQSDWKNIKRAANQ